MSRPECTAEATLYRTARAYPTTTASRVTRVRGIAPTRSFDEPTWKVTPLSRIRRKSGAVRSVHRVLGSRGDRRPVPSEATIAILRPSLNREERSNGNAELQR
jgi:hypothetical protein